MQYLPPLILRNGHAATIYPALFRRVTVGYQRTHIETPDGDFFDVDTLRGNDSKILVLLHGLEGSTSSTYIRGMARYFNKAGFTVHALNFRSCSGVPNLKLPSYHSGFTSDLRMFVSDLVEKHNNASIYFTGFSLGGNVLLKFLAEEGGSISHSIKAAVAISVPVDLRGSSEVLAKKENRIYMNRFLKTLRAKALVKASMFPGEIDIEGIHRIRTFREFDDRYTGPVHGFKDAHDYWEKCSSLFVLDQIRVPTLLLTALNDPFLSKSCFPEGFDKHPFLTTDYTKYGGHVGFTESLTGSYWSEKRVGHFFSTPHE